MIKQQKSFGKKSAVLLVVLASLILAFQVYAMGADSLSPWAERDVRRAMELGIVPEALQSRYAQEVTRAEFCALAVALFETVTGKEIESRRTFGDTDDINVEKAAAIGIVTGIGDGKFSPDTPITREQAAVMLVRLAGVLGQPLPEQSVDFSDIDDISPWAIQSIGQVRAAGIMGGVGNGAFLPKGSYTVEQGIVTMARLAGLVIVSGVEGYVEEPLLTITDSKTPLGAFTPLELTKSGQYTAEMVRLVNIERAKAGVGAVVGAEVLNSASSVRAKEISEVFSHNRPDGRLCFTVLDELGATGTSRAENIAGNHKTSEQVVAAWMDSPGHRKNILNPDYTKIGVGVFEDASGKLYWVQMFTN